MALKYTCEITINKPREEVVRLMDDPANMKHWQPGFISLEPLTGTPGEKGAKSLLKYKMGRRDMEMTETISERNLPEIFSAIYEAENVWNEQINRFIEVDAYTTKWVSESVFKMGGPMKLMAWLMPGMFKKQSQQYLGHFKAFVEEGKSLAK
ncbi:MAG: SRPBCC family protein [Flavobacteriales bacterium]|nr:SRPBCC family protein [Flavobacteriales bacterium]